MMAIIQTCPSLAGHLMLPVFPSSGRGCPRMTGMPSVLVGIYVELLCHCVFRYQEPYVRLWPWQYLTILALYT